MDRRKPKARTVSKAERDARKLNEVIEILLAFVDPQVLGDLYARGEETAQIDGYPAGSSASSIVAARGVNRPTEHAVELLAGGKYDYVAEMAKTDDDWRATQDFLMERIEVFQGELSSIHGAARLMRKCGEVVFKAADGLRGRQSALQGDCLACQKPVSGVGSDKMRGGLCHSCSNRFYKERSDGQGVADWLGSAHPLANRRPAPIASREEVPVGVTYCA